MFSSSNRHWQAAKNYHTLDMQEEKDRCSKNRQPKQYGTVIPLPCLGVSVVVSKVNRAVAPKGTQSCTTHGFYVMLIIFLNNFQGLGGLGLEGPSEKKNRSMWGSNP